MRSKIMQALPGLLVSGTSTIALVAEDVQAELNSHLPLRHEMVEIQSADVEFLPGDGGLKVHFRGSFSGTVNMIKVRCGFGFSVMGGLRYDPKEAALFFAPTAIGSISIAPGEGMPLIDPALNFVGKAGTAIAGGAAAGARKAGGFAGRILGGIANRVVPGAVRRFGAKTASTVGDGVGSVAGTVAGKVVGGITVVQEMIQSLIIGVAKSFLKDTPVYRFADSDDNRLARSVIEDIAVQDGKLLVTISTRRHVGLQSWRLLLGGATVVGLGCLGLYLW